MFKNVERHLLPPFLAGTHLVAEISTFKTARIAFYIGVLRYFDCASIAIARRGKFANITVEIGFVAIWFGVLSSVFEVAVFPPGPRRHLSRRAERQAALFMLQERARWNSGIDGEALT